jgi:hypothetical protein
MVPAGDVFPRAVLHFVPAELVHLVEDRLGLGRRHHGLLAAGVRALTLRTLDALVCARVDAGVKLLRAECETYAVWCFGAKLSRHDLHSQEFRCRGCGQSAGSARR